MTELINRINELARKSKTTGLTEEEKHEQAALRRQYIDNIKANVAANLDNVYIKEADGSVTKLRKKGE